MASFMDPILNAIGQQGQNYLAIAAMKRQDEDRKIRNEQNALAQMLSGLQIRDLMRKQQEDEATKSALSRAFQSPGTPQPQTSSYPTASLSGPLTGQPRNVAGIQETPLYSGDASTVKLARTPEFERFARSLRDQIPGTSFVPSGNEIQVIPPPNMNPDDFVRQMQQIASGQGLTAPAAPAQQTPGQYPEIDERPAGPATVTPARIPPGMQGAPAVGPGDKFIEAGKQIMAVNPAEGMKLVTLGTTLNKQAAENGYSLSPGQTRYDANGRVIAQAPEKGEYGQPIKVMKPDGSMGYAQVDKQGNVKTLDGIAPPPQKGMTIESDGKGGFTIQTNADQTGAGMTKPTQSLVEKDVLNTNEMLTQLTQIEKSLDPKFLELGTRMGTFFSAGKEKFGIKLNEGDKSQLAEYTNWRRGAFEMLNKYMNQLSGAAISPSEMERLQKAMPDPGTSIFNGDSPTEFQTKLGSVTKSTKMALARYNYTRKNGMKSFDQVPLDAMPKIIQSRGDEIAGELMRINPEASEAAIKNAVSSRLADEFGLVYQ